MHNAFKKAESPCLLDVHNAFASVPRTLANNSIALSYHWFKVHMKTFQMELSIYIVLVLRAIKNLKFINSVNLFECMKQLCALQ